MKREIRKRSRTNLKAEVEGLPLMVNHKTPKALRTFQRSPKQTEPSWTDISVTSNNNTQM